MPTRTILIAAVCCILMPVSAVLDYYLVIVPLTIVVIYQIIKLSKLQYPH